MNDHFYAVILAGGGGARLWPKSRQAHPKHLINLFGNQTLIQDTYNRFKKIIPKERIYIITLKEYVKQTLEQLPDLAPENIIEEPVSKNTALAMGIASAFIYKKDPEAVIINEAADHVYQDDKRLKETVLAALDVASREKVIVAIGIRPTFAHTGLGYIKIGDQIEQIKCDGEDIFVFQGAGFKEKPDLVTAQSFLATGKYLWNANLYCWKAQTIFEAFKKHSPNLNTSIENFLTGKDLIKIYQDSESVQIDVAVSEKAENIVVIPGDFGWSDIGDWKVVWDCHDKDTEDNVLIKQEGEIICLNTKGSLIEGNGRTIAAIGLENMVIIDTKDALLICPKDKTQDVKKLVEQLKTEKKEKLL